MKHIKVAIQGVQGSFHHLVASEYFRDTPLRLDMCSAFADMPDKVINDEVDYLVMAIENTIAGSILPNYALIDAYSMNIVGEYYLQIDHQLLGLEGQSLEDIRQVRSHPMALLQCRPFLKKHLPWAEIIEDIDTAAVAERIVKRSLKGVAAIASVLASSIHQLDILAKNIQTERLNFTRFFVLSKHSEQQSKGNKASCRFVLADESGSLGTVLMGLSDIGINLSKIQSLPIVQKPWRYAFFADLVADSHDHLRAALVFLASNTKECKVLGTYEQQKPPS